LRAVCSTVGLYCVTITWQQIFKGSLQVTVESVLPHVTVETYTSGQVYFSERLAVDSGTLFATVAVTLGIFFVV